MLRDPKNWRFIWSLTVLLVSWARAQYSFIPMSIQMRDGKYLAADLYTIDTLIPKPCVLIQTPYNKFWYRFVIGNPNWQVPFDSIAYNYLVVDWRGFHGSASADSAGYDRGLDGYDLVEFIASNQWSNGKVGTWGASALGVIQFMTAKHRPAHLTCCVPVVADPIFAYTDYYYGGDFIKELTVMRDSLGFTPASLILAHYKYDIFWILAEMLTDYPESVNVPVLMVTGWYDHNNDAPLEFFYALREESDTLVRGQHKFMVGPWTHSSVGLLDQGELMYPDAVDSLRGISFRIFDYYLRGIGNGYQNEPAVRYYQLGEDVWYSADDWYAVSNSVDTLYLQESGVLLEDPPGFPNPPDSFLYDPRDPSPSIGGNRFDPFNSSVIIGPRDQRDSVESRSDVVVYTTPIMTEPFFIDGTITVNLTVSSDCEDTDFSVRITDVYPDNRSMLITEGIRRMRFRNSCSVEELVVPGDTYTVSIGLKNIAYTFMPGHSMRIIVSSSDYPMFDININNGDSLYVPGDTVVANNKIFHEPGLLSLVIMETKSQTALQEQGKPEESPVSISACIFREKIDFEFFLHAAAHLDIILYDVAGRKTATLVHEYLQSGKHRIRSDVSNIPEGIYFVQFVLDNHVKNTEKVVILQ